MVGGGCREAGGRAFACGTLDGGLARAALVDGLDERAHADAQRSGDVGFVELEDKRLLARAFLHETADLVGKVGVMAAAETHNLHIFQSRLLRRHHGAGEHPGMEIVGDLHPGLMQVRL